MPCAGRKVGCAAWKERRQNFEYRLQAGGNLQAGD